ncbi:MAG TPA: DUF2202 domain-containing protein [Motilibacterales bacterium]|nr:DUF2202 domain-containing protein [Motilibacterales bacterium]
MVVTRDPGTAPWVEAKGWTHMDRNVTAALMLAGGGVLAAAGLTMVLSPGQGARTTEVAAQAAPSAAAENWAAGGQGNGRGQGGGGGNVGAGGGYGQGAGGGGQGRGAGGGNGQGMGGSGTHGQGAAPESHATVIPPTVPGATISPEIAEQLAFMVEEEKLARDVYALAKAAYPDARVFSNINRSESSHMSQVQVLLTRYDVADPTVGRDPGEFADDSLQALYDALADRVPDGREEAAQVGVDVEVRDIADLRTALALDAPADVTAVLGNLLAGSERHLAAFQRNGGTSTDA